MKIYKGARYISNKEKIIGKTSEKLRYGVITMSIPEREAIARRDFEPVYENDKVKKNNINLDDKTEE